MSYKSELRSLYRARVAGMAAIVAGAEGRKMTEAEKADFYRLQDEARTVECKLANAKSPRTDYSSSKNRTASDESFTRYLRTGEVRADGTGFTTAPNDAGLSGDYVGYDAGYMIPQGFWGVLQIAMKAYGGTSNDFNQVVTDTGNPMPWPTVDPTNVTATLLSGEANQLSLTEPYQFGQGMLNSWTYVAGPFIASLQLVEDSAFDVDNFVAARCGEALGRSIAAAAISGTGSAQPLGIITALNARGAWSAGSSGGYIQLGTATSVSTFGGSKTELVGNLLSAQTLLNMIEAVDPAYRNDPDGNPTAKFYMNDAQLAGIRTITDSYGRALLQDPAHEQGCPTLWGYPITIDNNIPNLTASTTGGPMFGDLSTAMVLRSVRGDARIVRQANANVMRLTERYADYLAVGYIGYLRMDTRSNDLRAAVTVKAAAS